MLRLMGDQASYMDLRSIIDAVMDSTDFRSRCNLLSHLVLEEPIEHRQELCRHTVVAMLSDCKPEESGFDSFAAYAAGVAAAGGKSIPTQEDAGFRSTTPQFAQNCVPPPHGPWHHHLQARYRLVRASSRGQRMKTEAEFALVSPYLFDRVAAVESLWGVQGHLLKR